MNYIKENNNMNNININKMISNLKEDLNKEINNIREHTNNSLKDNNMNKVKIENLDKETNKIKEVMSILKGEIIYLKDDFNNEMNIIKENNNKFKEDNKRR